MSTNHNRKMVLNALQRKSRTARDLSSTTKLNLTKIYDIVNELNVEGIVTFHFEKNLRGRLTRKYFLITTPTSHGM